MCLEQSTKIGLSIPVETASESPLSSSEEHEDVRSQPGDLTRQEDDADKWSTPIYGQRY